MFIKRVKIHNFKNYKDFDVVFNNNVNVVVGNNNEGKTTLFEAIHLALTATLHGRSVVNDIPAHIVNIDSVNSYLNDIHTGKQIEPPIVYIEVYFTDKVNNGYYTGSNCSDGNKNTGVKISFTLNPNCRSEYIEYIKHKDDVKTLPIEYYKCDWYTFADNGIVKTNMPVRSNYIDISTSKYLLGPDRQVIKIVEDALTEQERTDLSIAYRKLKEQFKANPNINELNKKIAEKYQDISSKELSLNIEVASRSNWEESFTTYFDGVPFNYIGKGEQSAFKIKLALSSQQDKYNVVLIEEPENHLSYSNMAKLIDDIVAMSSNTQVIISTHSAYVLNKLNLNNVILVQNRNKLILSDLTKDTVEYFEKLPGYDTLRLILSHRVILVEGPSDELIIQKLYKQKYGILPIENGVDVICVRGLAFARFLEVAQKLNTEVTIVTDNDGKSQAKNNKYAQFLCDKIKLAMSNNDELFTMEKILLTSNGKDKINSILGTNLDDVELLNYLIDNKTDIALKIFNSNEIINYIDEVCDVL